MDCLELNIHQQILSDIASNVSASGADVSYASDIITSQVQTRSEDALLENHNEDSGTLPEKVFMPASRVHCNIAFGELVVNFPQEHIDTTIDTLIPALIEVLRDVPYIDFDRSLVWEDWALPDQLVYSTVSALLRTATSSEKHISQALDAIFHFSSVIVQHLKSAPSSEILTQLAPALHGLYRAISSTTFKWSFEQWQDLTLRLKPLCEPDMVDRLNHLFVDILQQEQEKPETLSFIQTFLSRYVSRGRPLSGYFIVCCVIETEWTVLAQALASSKEIQNGSPSEAAAANKAWIALMRRKDADVNVAEKHIHQTLKNMMTYALECSKDLLVQIQDMDSEPAIDTYTWETLSESLKLASVCCVAMNHLEPTLQSRLTLLLSEDSPASDNLVQEAALQSITVLLHSFPQVAPSMTQTLRKFVTSPLPIFELEFETESRALPPLSAAAKCLALAIKLSPGDDLVMSNMYSLLNYIAATSKEIYEVSTMSINPLQSPHEQKIIQTSVEIGLNGMSEDEKRLAGISTISVVTRLALEFKMEDVTHLTISMLLQRLRSAEPTVEAAIAYNLVDLALSAPESAFVDVIRAFSGINRSANPEDPRFSNNMILAAQTRLAQELYRRPELYEVYLVELLTLFADKGVAIQNVKTANKQVKTDDMIEQLASLLLPIDSLISHSDFNVHLQISPSLVSLYRNMWFLIVLFEITGMGEKDQDGYALDWLKPALHRIAAKTPATVLEESHDSIASDVEYNSVVRADYAHTVISQHRQILLRYIPTHHRDIQGLSPGQIVFLLAMHDVESMRSSQGLTSSLPTYFVNDSLNRHVRLHACMDLIAKKVMRGCLASLNAQASQQALPDCLSAELRCLLVGSTHRIEKSRNVASNFLDQLLTTFPSLMCDPPLVFAILEVLTLLRNAVENAYTDEYDPIHEYHSERSDITLQLTDSYTIREKILQQLMQDSDKWFELVLARAPMELRTTLQKYLAVNPISVTETSELGASIAQEYGRKIGPLQRHLNSLGSLVRHLPNFEIDSSKALAGQLASKSYFAGESAGLRLAWSRDGQDRLEKMPPHATSAAQIDALIHKLRNIAADIRNKNSSMTVQDMKRLSFRAAATLISLDKCNYELLHHLVALPFEVSTPSAMSAGIEVWTWVIAERPEFEVALMNELLSAWSDSIKSQKGIFSPSLNHDDPFYHPVGYSPTNKEEIDRGLANARRLLTPLTLVLQMLFSRLQAARYRRRGVMFLVQHIVLRSARAHQSLSTHCLAREARFSFLLFGFETLKSSYLDTYCENALRESLYSAAYSWFAVRPQWSYGGNRVQVVTDLKVLSEFLGNLTIDHQRAITTLSSLTPAQHTSRTNRPQATTVNLKKVVQPLKILTENEIFRLMVWGNPANDRGTDQYANTDRALLDSTWTDLIRTAWQINPAVSVFLTERCKIAAARNELGRLVRTHTTDVVDVPEALPFLLNSSTGFLLRDLKHLLLWSPVPPVVACTFFESRYNKEPTVLQYAHRVLEEHPVDLTFFFVPQVVQALRYDKLGYVAHFIFETAKISQLFCHQIIWNMKANCYKDDLADIEDPMKPELDKMTDMVVQALSGQAREFYDREFGFFNEVTSISGKLKPFIKKTKAEKKAKIDEEMAKIVVDVGVYLPSNPDGEVVDIDKRSGRPLQSHAKAPFMATFKVRKERVVINSDPDSLLDGDGEGVKRKEPYDVWQAAIFKVGDDCRQDVLALQIIAMFKNIFMSIGLNLYLFPYRVTATGPGCGVIDVVPNATSRDEMGRAKVNDLLDFFVAKYGGTDTVAFQRARLNFIQSMAAYSLACYILQIKDRHNGNIMIDGEGHIVHIDFGFLFDIDKSSFCLPRNIVLTSRFLSTTGICVQGVKFEPSSFKLNHEMIELMGGGLSQGYQLFRHLAIKAFLAIRPHADQLVSTVQLMLDTGLPSFKGEGTIKRLRDRFALELSERQAAEYMDRVIRNAYENYRSTVYDEFQRLQNGIPYK